MGADQGKRGAKHSLRKTGAVVQAGAVEMTKSVTNDRRD
jgi:hypothetical protein